MALPINLLHFSWFLVFQNFLLFLPIPCKEDELHSEC